MAPVYVEVSARSIAMPHVNKTVKDDYVGTIWNVDVVFLLPLWSDKTFAQFLRPRTRIKQDCLILV